MVDTKYVDDGFLVIDAIQQPVGAASCAVAAGELTGQRFTDPSWIPRQVTEGELDYRWHDPGRDAVQVAAGGGGETDFMRHVLASLTALGYAKIGPDFVFTKRAAGSHIGFSLSDRLANARLG